MVMGEIILWADFFWILKKGLIIMKKIYILIFVPLIMIFSFSVYAGEPVPANQSGDIVLTPADQMILQAIEKMGDKIDSRIDQTNERIDQINGRIDQINGRIDNLWVAMISGFIGVMGIITAIVFWDRKTFVQKTKKEVMLEMTDDKRKLDAMFDAFSKMSHRFSEIKEAMNSHGF